MAGVQWYCSLPAMLGDEPVREALYMGAKSLETELSHLTFPSPSAHQQTWWLAFGKLLLSLLLLTLFFIKVLRVHTGGLYFLFFSLFKFDAEIDLKCPTENHRWLSDLWASKVGEGSRIIVRGSSSPVSAVSEAC